MIILKKILLIMFTITILSAEQYNNNKNLLFYCGVTMIKPMQEIAKIIEKKYNVKIVISQGASRDLKDSLLFSKKGDLFLPGSDSYLKDMKKQGIVIYKKYVGFNKAAIFVHKNNPLKIKYLKDLENPNLNLTLADPNAGSIGRMTQKLLISYRDNTFLDTLYFNSIKVGTDSRTLNEDLINNIADVTINWQATAVWDNNAKYIDTISIDEKYAPKKNLVLALLSFSKNKKVAKAFIEYASSKDGQIIMKKYGFLD